MPGIYINDGGETSSALSKILGGIAESYSPKARAEAQLLYQQTGQADVARQLGLLNLGTRTTAIGALPDYLRINQADPGGGGGVAGTAASLAQPPPYQFTPNSTAMPDESTFSPTAKIFAPRIAQGDFSPAEAATAIDLGRAATLGAGHGYGTEAEVAKANMLPHDLPLGTTRTTPRPDLGAAPAGVEPKVESGGSPVEQDVQKATADEALGDQRNGVHASDAVASLSALQALRDTVVQGHFTPGDVVYDEAAKAGDRYFGTGVFTRLNDRTEIMKAIAARMKAITAATRVAFAGDPAMRGLAATLDEGLPDPESDQFNNSVEALKQTLNATVDDANAAGPLVNNPADPGLAREFRSGKLARHQAAAAAADAALKAARAGGGGGGGGGGGPPAPPAPVSRHPATDQEKVWANQAIAAGQSRADVIAHALQKGIDLEASGF